MGPCGGVTADLKLSSAGAGAGVVLFLPHLIWGFPGAAWRGFFFFFFFGGGGGAGGGGGGGWGGGGGGGGVFFLGGFFWGVGGGVGGGFFFFFFFGSGGAGWCGWWGRLMGRMRGFDGGGCVVGMRGWLCFVRPTGLFPWIHGALMMAVLVRGLFFPVGALGLWLLELRMELLERVDSNLSRANDATNSDFYLHFLVPIKIAVYESSRLGPDFNPLCNFYRAITPPPRFALNDCLKKVKKTIISRNRTG